MKLQHGEIMEVANYTRAAGVFTALGSTWHELALDNEMPRYVDHSREVTIALDDPQATRVREHILARQKLARQQARAQQGGPCE